MDQIPFTKKSFAIEIRRIMRVRRTDIMDALMLFMAEYEYNEHDVNHWITPELKQELEDYSEDLNLL